MINTSTVIDETIQLSKEIWIIQSTYGGGLGTKTDPYKAPVGNIDTLIPLFGDNCKVHLAAGNYTTLGFKVPKYFILLGEGKDSTFLKLQDNANSNFNYPHLRIFADKNWSSLFILKNLTLDGNWKGQANAETSDNFKIEPVAVNTIRGKVENVRVINFGANGKAYKDGLECFPLCLMTFSNGDPFQYSTGFQSLAGQEDQTYVEISECEVTSPYFFNGYCTAIFVRTNFVGQGDRQATGVRTTRAATVKNNFVSVPGGIAYGAASAEMVLFEGNVAIDSKCGFNFDTFSANRISIINNQFVNCSQGINFTPSDGGTGIVIDRNIFTVGPKFFNPILKTYEEFYAVKTRYLQNSSANNNYVLGSDDAAFKFFDGITGVNNTIVKTGVSAPVAAPTVDNSVAMTDLMNKNVDLTNKNLNLTNQVAALTTQNTNLTNSVNSLNLDISDKTQKLQDAIAKYNVLQSKTDKFVAVITDYLKV